MSRIASILTVSALIVVICVAGISASVGDNSQFFQKCVHKCNFGNCSGDGVEFRNSDDQPLYLKAMLWNCADECRYNCMWKTVDSFVDRGWDVPQFNGKWPFIRILGVQEFASTLFSIMNFAAHFVMLTRFRRAVRKQSPLYWVWQTYAIICLNAWLWSAIFHTRDFDLTEKMDYLCAFSMVLFSLFAMMVRVVHESRWRKSLIGFVTACCTTLFVHHVTYLLLVRFDYGYNMMVNICVGVLNGVGWLLWALLNRKCHPRVAHCVWFVLLTGLSTVFEVADFPPFLWLVDAHSLWHLGTVALPFFFYRFLIEDCKYLRKRDFADREVIISPLAKTKSC